MVMHCKWLKLGTIELCNTKTKNEYCDKPNHKQYIPSCKSCDVGTKSKELICTQCNNYEESRYKCKICVGCRKRPPLVERDEQITVAP